MKRLIVVSLVCAGSCILVAGRAEPQMNGMANRISLEKRAVAAKGNDPQAVAALVDGVFSIPRAFPRLPGPVESAVKNRLVQAEILYRQGKGPGVQEQDVVDTLNELVDRLGGPPYLKTTLSQVRVLRMSLAFRLPIFMGTGVARPAGNVGESISTSMGPTQAVNLIETLIDHKIREPNLQVTPEEWEAASLAKYKAQIAEEQGMVEGMRAAMRKNGLSKMAALTARSLSTDKRREIEQKFYPKISALSLVDGLTLIDHAFIKLHID